MVDRQTARTIETVVDRVWASLKGYFQTAPAGEQLRVRDSVTKTILSAVEAGELVPGHMRATPRSELRRQAFTNGVCPICTTPLQEPEDPEDTLERA